MSAGQRRSIDPWALAKRDGRLELRVAIADMKRLSEMLAASDGWSRLDVAGHRDEAGHRHLRGRVSARVTLQCQRCLEPFRTDLDTDFDYTLVESESATASLGPEADALLVAPGSTVDLAALAEDELILSVPIVAMHSDTSECAPGVRSFGAAPEESPFSRLGELWAQRGSEHEE